MPACPHCGFHVEPGEESCPLCGSPVRDDPTGGRRRGAAGSAATRSRDGRRVAWEDPASPFPQSLWRSWVRVLSRPTDFFRSVSHEEPLARPLLYFLLISVVGGFFTLMWNAILGTDVGVPGRSPDPRLHFIVFFLTPFVAVAALAVSTLVFHFFALFLAPERRSLRATARALCYSASPGVLTAVPVLGPLVATVWMLVLEVIGLREVHRTSTLRAVLIVVLPSLLAALSLIALILLAYAYADLPAGWPPGS